MNDLEKIHNKIIFSDLSMKDCYIPAEYIASILKVEPEQAFEIAEQLEAKGFFKSIKRQTKKFWRSKIIDQIIKEEIKITQHKMLTILFDEFKNNKFTTSQAIKILDKKGYHYDWGRLNYFLVQIKKTYRNNTGKHIILHHENSWQIHHNLLQILSTPKKTNSNIKIAIKETSQKFFKMLKDKKLTTFTIDDIHKFANLTDGQIRYRIKNLEIHGQIEKIIPSAKNRKAVWEIIDS